MKKYIEKEENSFNNFDSSSNNSNYDSNFWIDNFLEENGDFKSYSNFESTEISSCSFSDNNDSMKNNFNSNSCKEDLSDLESDNENLKLQNRISKRSLLYSDERKFILFINTLFKIKWKQHKNFNLFLKPSYKLFNNNFKNISKRVKLLSKSLHSIVLDERFYAKKESIIKNQIILKKLEIKEPELFQEIQNASIRSYITPETIIEVLNSNEFLKKIKRKSENIEASLLIEKIKNIIHNYVYTD